jgi:uncharacterized membrane protein YeaQ/YmgE (transglycosylase-associated protein family)
MNSNIIWFFVVGVLIGWFANLLLIPRARRYSSLIIFGLTVAGAVIGGIFGPEIPLENPLIISILTAILGSVIFVWALSFALAIWEKMRNLERQD